MSIIPLLRCQSLRASLAFYTQVLDFVRVDGGGDDLDDPGFAVLARHGAPLALSSHRGDGGPEQRIIVTTNAVDADVAHFRARGLVVPAAVAARSPVHAAPVDQSWGTREFYVDDPDGHTLRFVQGWDGQGAHP